MPISCLPFLHIQWFQQNDSHFLTSDVGSRPDERQSSLPSDSTVSTHEKHSLSRFSTPHCWILTPLVVFPLLLQCVNKLMPQNGVFGTSFLGGFMRKDTQGNPCKGPTKLHRKLGNRCRCNLARIFCKPGDTFCQVLKEKCNSYVDLPCNGPTDNTTCGPPEQVSLGCGLWVVKLRVLGSGGCHVTPSM
jgi:hypothetical protein